MQRDERRERERCEIRSAKLTPTITVQQRRGTTICSPCYLLGSGSMVTYAGGFRLTIRLVSMIGSFPVHKPNSSVMVRLINLKLQEIVLHIGQVWGT